MQYLFSLFSFQFLLHFCGGFVYSSVSFLSSSSSCFHCSSCLDIFPWVLIFMRVVVFIVVVTLLIFLHSFKNIYSFYLIHYNIFLVNILLQLVHCAAHFCHFSYGKWMLCQLPFYSLYFNDLDFSQSALCKRARVDSRFLSQRKSFYIWHLGVLLCVATGPLLLQTRLSLGGFLLPLLDFLLLLL